MKNYKEMKVADLQVELVNLGLDQNEIRVLPGKAAMAAKCEELTRKPKKTNFFQENSFEELMEKSENDTNPLDEE
jgi:hypothetical protein